MPDLDPALERTDADIVRDVLAGRASSFEVLVRRHNQRLYRAARAVLGSDQDAEDALQQAWLRIYRNLAAFRGEAAFTTWTTRIAINEAISHARQRPAVVEVRDAISDAVAPDDAVARTQLGRLLECCLEAIPQGNREVMVLRDVLELDTAETAACLRISEEAVRVRLHRARAAVAAALAERMEHARDVYRFDGERCDRITANVMAAIAGT